MRQIAQAELHIVDGLAKFLKKTIKLSDKIDRFLVWTMFECGASSKSCGMGWFISICTKGDGVGCGGETQMPQTKQKHKTELRTND